MGSNMRLIVSVGWAIYPLGYVLGCLKGSADETALNVVYNIADLVNKIGFMLSCLECLSCDLYLFSVNIEAFTKGDFCVFVAVRMCVCQGTPSSIFKGAHVLGTSRSIAFPTIVAM